MLDTNDKVRLLGGKNRLRILANSLLLLIIFSLAESRTLVTICPVVDFGFEVFDVCTINFGLDWV